MATPILDALADGDLEDLNRLLPWSCFTVDGKGRRLGDAAWDGKRVLPQDIPDRRIDLMDERFGLSGRRVLEVGCFEGVHTIGLCNAGASVVAVDARIENVVKTIVRTSLYGCAPEVRLCDVEDAEQLGRFEADLCHHVGVLYHLRDPIGHLGALGKIVRSGIMLDTHVATDEQASEEMVHQGETYAFHRYLEGGRADVFSGMHGHARWLTTEGLLRALGSAGFHHVDLVETREERNGLRILIHGDRGC